MERTIPVARRGARKRRVAALEVHAVNRLQFFPGGPAKHEPLGRARGTGFTVHANALGVDTTSFEVFRIGLGSVPRRSAERTIPVARWNGRPAQARDMAAVVQAGKLRPFSVAVTENERGWTCRVGGAAHQAGHMFLGRTSSTGRSSARPVRP